MPNQRHRPDTKAYWFTYQSGLFTIDDKPKPAVQAYMLPFIAFPIGLDPETNTARISIWGQLRFRPNNEVDKVQIEFAPVGASEFQPLGDPVEVAPGQGFFSALRTSPGPGYWRAHWFAADGVSGLASRVIALG